MTRALGGIETQMAIMHQELSGTTQGAQGVRLGGNIGAGELRDAAEILFDVYPILRCGIAPQGEGFRFVAHDDFDRLQLRELPHLADSTLDVALEEEVADPVDPADMVWRLAISGDNECDERIVVLTCHHAVIDGFGFQVLFRALFQAVDALRRGIEPSRTEGPFPSPIDDFLLPGGTGPGRQSMPFEAVPHHADASLTARRTRLLPVQLSLEESRDLDRACAARRISVNALLSAALAAASRDLKVIGSATPFKTAVSLRDRVAENGMAVDELGCYIAVADAVLQPKPLRAGGYDLVALAKEYDAQLLSSMLATCLRKPSVTSNDLFRVAQSFKDGATFTQGIGIANAGTVTVDAEYETLQVLDWQGINNRVGGNVSIVLHPLRFGGTQKLGFVYPEPLVDGEVVRAVSTRFLELLGTVVEGADHSRRPARLDEVTRTPG